MATPAQILSIRRLIPDLEQPYHFDDDTLSEWYDDYQSSGKDENKIKYYVARRALVNWIKQLKLTDADIKQNSLSVGATGASREKLLDLLNASIADLEQELQEIDPPYFDVVSPKDDFSEEIGEYYGY